jgi:uncharacterized damage-inducible protein DinB
MEILFEEYLKKLGGVNKSLSEALKGLPQEALDWKPGEEMNSLAVLATHTAAATRFWSGDVISQVSTDRDRPAEFRTWGVNAETLIARLDGSVHYCTEVVAALTLDDLDSIRRSPMDGHDYSIAYGLLHILEHCATHLGHMQVTRQMWEKSRE